MRLREFRCNLLLTHSQAMKKISFANTFLLVAVLIFSVGLGSYSITSSHASAESKIAEEQSMIYCFNCPDCGVTAVGRMFCDSDGCEGTTCFTVIEEPIEE